MNCRIINNSDMNLDRLLPVLKLFLPYAQKHMGFDQPVDIEFVSDPGNSKKLLGKTAYYDPNEKRVCIFVDNRHPKDMMKSIAHELAHHTQNCRGDLDLSKSTDPGYAQKDKHMRKMEDEAYKTLLLFRDFEDTHRHLIETHLKGEIKMSYKNWRNQEMFDRLMENYGYKKPEAALLNENVDGNTGMSPMKEESGEEEGEHYESNVEDDEDHIDAIRRHLDALEKDRDYDEDHVEETVSSREDPRNRKTGENTNLREDLIRRAVREALIQKLKK
jgi:hypothetical protein